MIRNIFRLPLARLLAGSIPFAAAYSDEPAWPLPEWESASPEEVGMDVGKLNQAKDYALTGDGSGMITKNGKVVLTWGDQRKRYDLKSTTKSIGVSALGLAIKDGKIALDDKVTRRHPDFATQPASNLKTGWIDRITIQNLATQTAGFEKPGGYTKLIYEPGTRWLYSDSGPNWRAECVTLAYKRDVEALMFERVFTPLGITRDDLRWRRNAYRPAEIAGVMRREFGSGISANVNAMARIGYLYLRKGMWDGSEILPAAFVGVASQPVKEVVGLEELDHENHGNASDHYGLLWWNNADETLEGVPRDAYWSWGLYDSLIVVIPSLDIVVARAGKSWKRKSPDHYSVLAPFLNPIVASVKKGAPGEKGDSGGKGSSGKARPSSPVISGIDWEEKSKIIRMAKGSDNWPITWGDDDALYTAYGDGRGFEPFVEKKLSMGLCRVTGPADDPKGENLRSPTAERTGGGASGPKVSGMLMVDGILYLLVRNTKNSQLAWSRDRGETWTWADWRFETSFGYATFLNFGRNYEGARDDFVYIYSHDSDSAYQRADSMVMARVTKEKLTDKEAYEYFVRTGSDGEPVWSGDVKERGPVFIDAGNCYRSSVSYSRGLKRYLWCQIKAGKDTRFDGGFAIYDAPEPWGPWTTAYSVERWDVGPGETSCLPTKWMSEDGKEIHLVFSGDDCFSVRKGTLRLGER